MTGSFMGIMGPSRWLCRQVSTCSCPQWLRVNPPIMGHFKSTLRHLSTSEDQPVARLVELDRPIDGVTRITLQDPQRRNPLSMSMLHQLGDALKEEAENVNTRVIILASTGSVFCAGHNLRDFAPGTPKDHHVEILR